MSQGKKQRSVTIPTWIDDLARNNPDLNLSGLVTRLLLGYFEHQDAGLTGLEAQIKAKEEKRREFRAKVKELDAQIKILKEEKQAVEEARIEEEEILDQARQILAPKLRANGRIPPQMLDFWAEEAGLTRSELLDDIEQYVEDGLE